MNTKQYLEALLKTPCIITGIEEIGPKISPNGKWVAWSWLNAGSSTNVYLVPTDGSSSPLQLTNTPGNTLLVSWTPDNQALLVAQDKDGNERFQLFRVNINRPGVMVPLTKSSPNYFLMGGQLHPNGRWLIYGANFNFTTNKEIEPTWIYRHDIKTGEKYLLAAPPKPAICVPQLNYQGSHILYNRNDLHPSGQQIWLVDIKGKEDKEILNFGPSVKVFASWFPDGNRVLFLVETDTYRRLGVWHLKTGKIHWLLDDPSRNIENAFVPYGSDYVVIIEIKEACLHSSLLHLETKEEIKLPLISGNLIPLAPLGGSTWIGEYYSARQPVELVRFSLKDVQSQLFISLTKVWERTPLSPDELTPAENFHWKSVDGLKIQGWLYQARKSVKGTIIHVHGGPTSYSEDSFNPLIQFLVSQGFNVLDPNYRGSTGFGLAFQEAIKKDGWGGLEQGDIQTGIKALIAKGIAQPFKVGITGSSYGGYSSWCAITRYSPQVLSAAAPICGMTDLVVDYSTTRPDIRPSSEEMMGGSPKEVPKRYHDRSPIHFVGNIKGKLLIIQGLQDPNVSPENVWAVRAALEKANIPYGLLTFKDEGHGIKKPRNLKKLYLRLVKFFEDALEKRIVVTGGHLTPALAVIDELQKRGNWKIFYIGRKYSAEGDKTPSLESMVIQEKGFWFIPINFGRLQHKFTRYTIPAFLRIPWGFILSFCHLAKVKPDVILSFGSYVGVPVVISGWLLGIPIVLHEQTTVVGLGNKINSFFARKICVSWPQTLDHFSKAKAVLTGNPLRDDIFKTKKSIWQTLKFAKRKPLILVTGGNQGSHRINVAIEGALEKLLTKYNLFHQTGHLAALGDFEKLGDKRNKLSSSLKASYHLKKYVTGEEWGTLLNKADLVISRAGINTITELLALGKPQLLIPIPWLPGDEQTKNAQMIQKIGLGEILPQDDLSQSNLLKKIEVMMTNLEKYRQNSTKAQKLVIKNATQKIVDELEKTT